MRPTGIEIDGCMSAKTKLFKRLRNARQSGERALVAGATSVECTGPCTRLVCTGLSVQKS
eukprot:1158359-Pelagomonas_calceolata.AAC.13